MKAAGLQGSTALSGSPAAFPTPCTCSSASGSQVLARCQLPSPAAFPRSPLLRMPPSIIPTSKGSLPCLGGIHALVCLFRIDTQGDCHIAMDGPLACPCEGICEDKVPGSTTTLRKQFCSVRIQGQTLLLHPHKHLYIPQHKTAYKTVMRTSPCYPL